MGSDITRMTFVVPFEVFRTAGTIWVMKINAARKYKFISFGAARPIKFFGKHFNGYHVIFLGPQIEMHRKEKTVLRDYLNKTYNGDVLSRNGERTDIEEEHAEGGEFGYRLD